jgi:hypothetical protein
MCLFHGLKITTTLVALHVEIVDIFWCVDDYVLRVSYEKDVLRSGVNS